MQTPAWVIRAAQPSRTMSDCSTHVSQQALHRMLDSLQQGTGFLVAKVDSCLAEVEDLLSYSNDILCTGACWRDVWWCVVCGDVWCVVCGGVW